MSVASGHLRYIDMSMSRIRNFMYEMGDIQNNISNIVHIAGTNGKGSTISCLAYILQEHGYTVNIFTSPHLISYNERFRILGNLISDDYLKEIRDRLSLFCGFDRLTMFELASAIAFYAFYNNPADFCLLETGLGGRLDATNIVQNKILSIITSIGLDHQKFLGNTKELIAIEKSKIISENSITLSGYQSSSIIDIFKQECAQRNSKLFYAGNDYHVKNSKCYFDNQEFDLSSVNLLGEHQHYNAALAIYAASKLINLSSDKVNLALSKVIWPARMQKINALCGFNFNIDIYIDGAHNDIGFLVFLNFLNSVSDNKNKIHIMLGMMKNKDLNQLLEILSSFKDKIVLYPCEIKDHTFYSKEYVSKQAIKLGIRCINCNDIFESAEFIYKDHSNNDSVFVVGSLYLAGLVLKESGYTIS